MSRIRWLLTPSLIAFASFPAAAALRAGASEPPWSPVVIARGEYRQQIEGTPIHERPYRPLHVYGNTVRRQYYRGSALPLPRDVGSAGTAMLRRTTVAPSPPAQSRR
jgi:hypothetical protein